MINIEIINDKIAIIKIKNFDNRELYTYEVYGNKGYNISGKIIIHSGKLPCICFEYNKEEYYFIKIIKNNEISYSRFFNPNNKNDDDKTFIKNISMKIEKSNIELEIDKEIKDDEQDNEQDDEQDDEESPMVNQLRLFSKNAEQEKDDNKEEDNTDENDNPEIISLEDIEGL